MTEALFWISVAAILYTYLGYPIAVWLLGRVRTRGILKSDITPRVSVVIACHNEQSNIDARIKNLVSVTTRATWSRLSSSLTAQRTALRKLREGMRQIVSGWSLMSSKRARPSL